jgi:TonB family protein
MSGPDPPEPLPAPPGLLREQSSAQPPEPGDETDFVDLAARLAALSGGGLSPELSSDLALEIVLNEIVEQACLATGATGAAVVLRRADEMVCRACSGTTAPVLGARLETASGLTGECIHLRRTQRSGDLWVDPRADVEASQQLGVRSVIVMPLQQGEELVGVIELFSSKAYAFGDRDERTLEALAHRALVNLERATQPLPEAPMPAFEDSRAWPMEQASAAEVEVDPSSAEPSLIEPVLAEPSPATSAVADSLPADPRPLQPFEKALPNLFQHAAPDKGRGMEYVTWGLGIVVFACAILLIGLVARHFWFPKALAGAPIHASIHTAAAAANPTAEATSNSVEPAPRAANATNVLASAKSAPAAPAGSLLVYENGKEVFRMPAADNPGKKNSASSGLRSGGLGTGGQGTGLRSASATEKDALPQLTPAAVEARLVHRVEPEYPEGARQQKIQGAVVVEMRISAAGAVQDPQVASGPAELGPAALDAVKQWRFKPGIGDARARVTLEFKLAQ